MKTKITLAIVTAIVLNSCQGLGITVNPDGSVSGSYTPPAPVVVAPTK